MHICLFGGAFNPPHLGHLIVIQQAFELIKPPVDELWLLPCYQHTFVKDMAPTSHRLAMLKLLTQQFPPEIKSQVKINTTEIDHQLSGHTYDALQILKPQYPTHQFSFLMGSDNLNSFTKWGNWQKLLQELPFYIYPRAGYEGKPEFNNMTLLESDTQTITNISSTLIRQRISKNLPLTHLVAPPIIDYIDKHNLYKN